MSIKEAAVDLVLIVALGNLLDRFKYPALTGIVIIRLGEKDGGSLVFDINLANEEGILLIGIRNGFASEVSVVGVATTADIAVSVK